MAAVNKKYTITASVLTPISVGQGSETDWVLGVDFVVKNNVMYHLDMKKMQEVGIDIHRMTQLFLQQDPKGMLHLIGNKLEEISDFRMKMPCFSSLPIKTFFRNQLTGQPVIPGSSLKGAIRSVLFAHFAKEKNVAEMQKQKSNVLNESVFGSLKDGSDFMRFIQVGDITFPVHSTELVNTKIYNLRRPGQEWEGGWKHAGQKTTEAFEETGFNTIYECLPYSRTGVGSLTIAQQNFDTYVKETQKGNSPAKQEIMQQSVNALCAIINNHTRRYLEKELKFFKKYMEGENADVLMDDDENNLGTIPLLLDELDNLQPNECIIKLAAGSGFHSITGDWQYTDYTGGLLDQKNNRDKLAKPKSRKIAVTDDGDGLFLDLMGFLKLTLE